MKTLARRSPRVLVVAALSSTAWVGSTVAAGAAETCDPSSTDCTEPATHTAIQPATELARGPATNLGMILQAITRPHTATHTATQTSTHTATHTATQTLSRTSTEKSTRTTERTEKAGMAATRAVMLRDTKSGPVFAAQSVAPAAAVTKADQVEQAEPPTTTPLAVTQFCQFATSDRPLAEVATRMMSRFLGMALVQGESGPAVSMPDGRIIDCDTGVALSAVETVTGSDLAARTEARTVTTAKAVETVDAVVAPTTESTGVDVDAVETQDGTAVAPEQFEVSAPATVHAALPKTGGDGALLTMLGLALIASGAAVRQVVRD